LQIVKHFTVTELNMLSTFPLIQSFVWTIRTYFWTNKMIINIAAVNVENGTTMRF
jgi:hypothetical protein